jgi:hypothetical protein
LLYSFSSWQIIAALTREHRSRVKCLVLARPARRDKVLDEDSAAIHGDASRRERR